VYEDILYVCKVTVHFLSILCVATRFNNTQCHGFSWCRWDALL